jgi:hypothetical protein
MNRTAARKDVRVEKLRRPARADVSRTGVSWNQAQPVLSITLFFSKSNQ